MKQKGRLSLETAIALAIGVLSMIAFSSLLTLQTQTAFKGGGRSDLTELATEMRQVLADPNLSRRPSREFLLRQILSRLTFLCLTVLL